MTNKITDLISKDKYKQEQLMFNDFMDVVNDYTGKVGVAAALGILNLVQDEIKDAKKKEKLK